MTECKKHPEFQIPTDAHGKRRYESAMKHVQAAKKAGKSSEEIHAIFKKVMEFDPKNIDSIPDDEAHAKYKVLFCMLIKQKKMVNPMKKYMQFLKKL